MQNKGAIMLFAVLFALISLYQLSFTVATWNVKNAAKKAAKGDAVKEAAYIDSVAGKSAYPLLGYTYRECQNREINLGLDLKGGMNVTLEVSVVELVKSMADFSKDPTFVKAIQLAQQKQKSSQKDFVTLFGESFAEVDKNAQLANIFNTLDLKDRIKFGTTNDEVIKILREETQDAIDNSFNILRTRIDRFGVVQPNIQKLEGSTGRILVELPGIKEPERVRKLLQGTANLQFFETYDNTEVYQYLLAANNKLKDIQGGEDLKVDSIALKDSTNTNAKKDTTKSKTNLIKDLTSNDTVKGKKQEKIKGLTSDSVATDASKQEGFKKFMKENPLFAVLRPNSDPQTNNLSKGAAVGIAHVKDTSKVNQILKMEKIQSLFPKDLRLMWEVKAIEGKNKVATDYFQLIAIKTDRDGKASLEGDVITGAREETDNTTGEWEVSMSMDATGAKVWALLTKNNIGKQVAIVLDGLVYSYPVVNTEITGGRSSISGNFTVAEAKDLANILKSGKLPAPAVIIEEEIVGPSLGKEAISSSLLSFVIAFVLVLLYMIFFYKKAGLIANVALLANVFFILGVLASLGAVLTLPGMAALVLTLGMAVDANVIIYERIKEELNAGKGIKLAVSEGYKHALSAIIDGNVTTLLTGIILYIFGHGPIQGFATTLIIGILTSLFTAIFITRIIITRMLERNKEVTFYTNFSKNFLANVNFDFIGKRKIGYIFSLSIIVIGIVSLFTMGLNQGVDFVGGRTYVVRFDKNVIGSDIADDLKASFGEAPEVKTFGSDNQVKIITKFMVDSKETNADSIVELKLFQGLKPVLGDKVTYAEFGKNYKMSSQKVGPTIADDIKVGALLAVFFSLIVIFGYVFIRFKNWQFGLGAVMSLAHDAFTVVAIFSLLHRFMPFSLEINQAFIAAVLTVIGYSVNDTVIIFDRIREYIGLGKGGTRKEIYNNAMNSTLGRTFNTSMTTLVVLFAIFLFGGEVIRGFVFGLLVGITIGTYSSIFVATPIVYDLIKEKVIAPESKSNKEYLGGKKNKKQEDEIETKA